MTAELVGRRALITGSTDGIGAALAERIAREGASVVITGRNAERGEALAGRITAAGDSATFVMADLSRGAEEIGRLADAASVALDGPVDLLVNNAALLIAPAPTSEVSEELIDQALAVSVRSAFLLTGRLAPEMVRRGSGAIVNLGSINGLRGWAHSALYSATKATMHSLTRSWAAEYGPAGVRVNAVAPGPTLTDKVKAMDLSGLIQRFPSGRPNRLDEVADAVVFLASDRASNIHGAILPVDGGFSAV